MFVGSIKGPLKMIITGREDGGVEVEFEGSDEDKKSLTTTIISGLLEDAKEWLRTMKSHQRQQQQPAIQLARGGFPNGTVRR